MQRVSDSTFLYMVITLNLKVIISNRLHLTI